MPLGTLLVQAGLLSEAALNEALAKQKDTGLRLGRTLIDAGHISEEAVTQLLSQQLSVPWVALHQLDFGGPILGMVSLDVAQKHNLIPIFTRRVRGVGEALYIAMEDPGNETALQEVAEHSGMHVRVMIAPPSDIRRAIHLQYGLPGEAPKASAIARASTALPPDVASRDSSGDIRNIVVERARAVEGDSSLEDVSGERITLASVPLELSRSPINREDDWDTLTAPSIERSVVEEALQTDDDAVPVTVPQSILHLVQGERSLSVLTEQDVSLDEAETLAAWLADTLPQCSERDRFEFAIVVAKLLGQCRSQGLIDSWSVETE